MMRPLVVLRPEPGNRTTTRAARELGLEVHPFPLFAMGSVPWAVPDASEYDAMLAGSANVFRLAGSGLDALRALPVHAVGATTTDVARQAGFAVGRTGEGGMEPLVAGLAPGRYLRLAGEKHVPLIPPPDVVVDTQVVYAAQPLPMPDALVAVLAGEEGRRPVVMLHSGEAAAHFAAQCDAHAITRGRIALACLAPRIATQAGRGWQTIEIGSARTDEALLALAAQMCQTVCP